MSNQVMFSIIIPAYNVGPYIEQCLNSILQQTYRDYEVIIVDDGSTDNTSKIVKDYTDRNDNFRLITQPNGGISIARNNGIKLANGKYVFYFDGDDYLPTNALERLANEAEEYAIDVLKFSVYTFEDDAPELKWGQGGYKYNGTYDTTYTGKEYLKTAVKNGDAYFVNCGHFITRREIIGKNNLTYIAGILHEDNIFHWELMMVADRVRVLNEPLACRRYRKGSIMLSGNWLKKIEAMSITIDATYEFAKKHSNIEKADYLWYVQLYARKILQFWLKMSTKERSNQEAIELISRVRKQMRSHLCWGKFNLLLFVLNPTIYEKYHKLNQWLRKNEKRD